MNNRNDMLEEMFATTQTMRTHQQAFFKTHTQAELVAAKADERKVDAIISRLVSGQGSLSYEQGTLDEKWTHDWGAGRTKSRVCVLTRDNVEIRNIIRCNVNTGEFVAYVSDADGEPIRPFEAYVGQAFGLHVLSAATGGA